MNSTLKFLKTYAHEYVVPGNGTLTLEKNVSQNPVLFLVNYGSAAGQCLLVDLMSVNTANIISGNTNTQFSFTYSDSVLKFTNLNSWDTRVLILGDMHIV